MTLEIAFYTAAKYLYSWISVKNTLKLTLLGNQKEKRETTLQCATSSKRDQNTLQKILANKYVINL